jgi:phospholipase C
MQQIREIEGSEAVRLITGTAFALFVVGLLGAYQPAVRAQACPPLPASPSASGIDHVVFIMMENRTFDHFLGWLPNSDGRQNGLTYRDGGVPHNTYSALTKPWNYTAPNYDFGDPDHGYWGMRTDWNNGLNDRWIDTHNCSLVGVNCEYLAISYYPEDPNLGFLMNNARTYTTLDRSFSSIMTQTWPNRLFAHAAQTDRLDNSATPAIPQWTTIWDLLANASVTRRYYVGANPPMFGNGLNYLETFWPNRYTSIYGTWLDFQNDLGSPNFPSVAFLEAADSSDQHPPHDIRWGDAWLNRAVSAIMNSRHWPSTVIVITFDEGGGFFDHVQPPRAVRPISSGYADTEIDSLNRVLLGFRIPSIIVSPFAVGSTASPRVNHLTFDHTSLLKLIEWRWSLPTLTARDASSEIQNLACALNFWNVYDQDVGTVGARGSSSLSGSTYTVQGAGTNIWDTADSFHFMPQPIVGDTQIIARVTNMGNTSPFAKAGVMIRETLNANSAHVVLDLRPTNDIEFMTRPSTGAATTFINGATQARPAWLKLVRSGTLVTAYVAADNGLQQPANWLRVGSTTLAIGSNAYIGVVVCSQADPVINISTFDNVAVTNPWIDTDVGAVGLTGTTSYAGGAFTMKGAGADIWGTADSFRFEWQMLTGNADIITQVTGIQNTDPFAKAGVMIRKSLDPGSAHVTLDLRPTPTNDLEFMTRPDIDAQTTWISSASQVTPWLRLVRTGSNVSAYYSPNGVSWTPMPGSPVTLNIGSNDPYYVGLVVASHNTTALNTSTFANVRVSQ